MNYRLKFLVLLTSGLLSIPSLANPITLRVSSGANSHTVSGNGSTPISFAGPVGPFVANVTVGNTQPFLTAPDLLNLLSIDAKTKNCFGSCSLLVALTATNFTQPVSFFKSTLLGTATSLRAAPLFSFSTYLSPTNTPFGQNILLGSCSGRFFVVNCMSTKAAFSGGLYSLTIALSIDAAPNSSINVDSDISAVPEPASMALLGFGLLSGALMLKQRAMHK